MPRPSRPQRQASSSSAAADHDELAEPTGRAHGAAAGRDGQHRVALPAECRAAVAALLAAAGRRVRIGSLHGGRRRRVGLALALVRAGGPTLHDSDGRA